MSEDVHEAKARKSVGMQVNTVQKDAPSGTRQLFSGIAWIALCRLVAQLFGWITTILVARLLMPSDYGLVGMVVLSVGFVALFAHGGIGASIVQKEALSERTLSALFWMIQAIAVVLYVICAITAPVAF